MCSDMRHRASQLCNFGAADGDAHADEDGDAEGTGRRRARTRAMTNYVAPAISIVADEWYIYLPHFEHDAAAKTLKCVYAGGSWLKKTTAYSGTLSDEMEHKRRVDVDEVVQLKGAGEVKEVDTGGAYDIMHRHVEVVPSVEEVLAMESMRPAET